MPFYILGLGENDMLIESIRYKKTKKEVLVSTHLEHAEIRRRLAIVLDCLPALMNSVAAAFYRDMQVIFKGGNPGDPVTKTDSEVQQTLLNRIMPECPHDGVLGEEDGVDTRADQRYIWLIDPIDGTTNFTRRNPCFVISVACFDSVAQDFVLGVIAMPITGEIFYAMRGEGTRLRQLGHAPENPADIRISVDLQLPALALATASVGFHSRSDAGRKEGLPFVSRFGLLAGKLRVEGSVAFAMTHVAWGKLGLASYNTNIWDMAAAVILVEEAGGLVTDIAGQPIRSLPDRRTRIFATTPALHAEVLTIARSVSG